MKESSKNNNLDSNQEVTANENLLYQRIIVFLIVFSVLVIGAVNTQRKILFLSILALGVIICWVLTFILIRTAKRIDNKSGGKIVRLLLGYIVPIFCSGLLTIALFFGSFGFVDKYLFNIDVVPQKIENKVNEIKNQIKPKADTTIKEFKNIDSVIAGSGVGIKSVEAKKNTPSKKAEETKYYKSIESIIKEKKK